MTNKEIEGLATQGQTNETSGPIFLREWYLRFAVNDCEHMLDLIDTLQSEVNQESEEGKDIWLSLDIAKDQIEEVYEKLQERKEVQKDYSLRSSCILFKR